MEKHWERRWEREGEMQKEVERKTEWHSRDAALLEADDAQLQYNIHLQCIITDTPLNRSARYDVTHNLEAARPAPRTIPNAAPPIA